MGAPTEGGSMSTEVASAMRTIYYPPVDASVHSISRLARYQVCNPSTRRGMRPVCYDLQYSRLYAVCVHKNDPESANGPGTSIRDLI